MQHGPPTNWKEDKSEGYKTKLGLILCAVFTIVYFAFIVLGVTNPQMMANDIGPLNVAVVYGFAIIILAIILAFAYNWLCSCKEDFHEKADKKKEAAD